MFQEMSYISEKVFPSSKIKRCYTSIYKKVKFPKLNYFLITIIKCFFSFYKGFNKFLAFIFWKIFVTFTVILSLFYFCSLERFWYLSLALLWSSLFCWSYFVDKVFEIFVENEFIRQFKNVTLKFQICNDPYNSPNFRIE